MTRVLALALVLPLCAWSAAAGQQTSTQHSAITMSDEGSSDDCSQRLRVSSEDFATVRDEEVRTIPNQPLNVTAGHNGGIQLTTWDKPEISMKLCKQAGAENEGAARKLLAETRLEINGGTVQVHTPDSDEDYSLGTLLLIRAPRGASLEMQAVNGGIALNGFDGIAKAKTENGGIAFKKSTGTLVAEAENGGISIKDCSGDVSANVENGGLSISLPEHWDGKGLEAHTHNGGLVIGVPQNISTGVEIVGSEHTSIICKDDVCSNVQRTWDSGHKILRLGSGNALVHATTVNGGIIVRSREHSRGEL